MTDVRAVTAFVLFALTASGLSAQDSNRCADCHFANVTSYRSHLLDWQMSAHSKNSVGCQACHGGDASTYEQLQAHDGVLNSGNPSSPVNYQNLPRTCGDCHVGVFEFFEQSKHWQLLKEGDLRGPSCSTCHSDAGGFLLSSRGLKRNCSRCHGEKGKAPHAEFPTLAAESHDKVDAVRELLDTASKLIKRIKDDGKRSVWEARVRDALAPLDLAVDSAHRFTFETFDAQIAEANSLAETLLADLNTASAP